MRELELKAEQEKALLEAEKEAAEKEENLFNRWCHSKEVSQDFKKLKQMILLEEFKDKVRPDIRSHLYEQKWRSWKKQQ